MVHCHRWAEEKKERAELWRAQASTQHEHSRCSCCVYRGRQKTKRRKEENDRKEWPFSFITNTDLLKCSKKGCQHGYCLLIAHMHVNVMMHVHLHTHNSFNIHAAIFPLTIATGIRHLMSSTCWCLWILYSQLPEYHYNLIRWPVWKQLYTSSISKMPWRHKQAQTWTHIMLMCLLCGPLVWKCWCHFILEDCDKSWQHLPCYCSSAPLLLNLLLWCRRHLSSKQTKRLCGKGLGHLYILGTRSRTLSLHLSLECRWGRKELLVGLHNWCFIYKREFKCKFTKVKILIMAYIFNNMLKGECLSVRLLIPLTQVTAVTGKCDSSDSSYWWQCWGIEGRGKTYCDVLKRYTTLLGCKKRELLLGTQWG